MKVTIVAGNILFNVSYTRFEHPASFLSTLGTMAVS